MSHCNLIAHSGKRKTLQIVIFRLSLRTQKLQVFPLFSSPLTKVKLINELNEREAALGVNDNVSWHSEYKESAWIFVGKTRTSLWSVEISHTDESTGRYLSYRIWSFTSPLL